jgi:hypothetical protein
MPGAAPVMEARKHFMAATALLPIRVGDLTKIKTWQAE